MTNPTTEYRDHTIRWSDNEDVWTCYDLSDKVRSSPKLSVIKAAIDRLYLTERKNNAVVCYEFNSGGERIESNVVEYLKAVEQRGYLNNNVTRIDHKVAVVAQRRGSERPSRREITLDQLIPATPEADAAWAHFVELRQIEKDARVRADAALAAVPRMQPTDVQVLVDLYERDKQG